ncbi:MAG: hypothetical protein QNJ72_12970, partial [Pleurocapsa sp. MO_226.B13]|nr:hypothetical protein [Pleurocapsa sp. MO_226.B13]
WSKVKNTLRSIGARTYQAKDSAIALCFCSSIFERHSIGVGSFLLFYLTILRRAIVNYINEHLDREIKLVYLARLLGMSQFHSGMTPKVYRNS